MVNSRFLKFAFLCGIVLVARACTFLGPKPTPEPIYVTATPVAQLETETPVNTAVLGATPGETEPVFPTFEPPTITSVPTEKPSLTPSFTPIPTDTPRPKGSKTAVLKCSSGPDGGFATIYGQDPTLQAALGCASGPAIPISSAALGFENGSMVWVSQFGQGGNRVIYAAYKNGTYQRYDDTWVEKVDPESTGETAPAGKLTPVRGFGKVWHNNATVKNGLGWALNSEVGTTGEIQRFERGEMVFVASQGQTYIFIGGTSWRMSATGF